MTATVGRFTLSFLAAMAVMLLFVVASVALDWTWSGFAFLGGWMAGSAQAEARRWLADR